MPLNLFKYLPGLRHWAAHLLWPAVVVASCVEILKVASFPVDVPFTAFMASSAYLYHDPVERDERQALALVLIDQARFDDKYRGTSPLNRCQLRDDIVRLLRLPSLLTLAIDFDLTKTRRSVDPANPENQCQAEIEAALRCPKEGQPCVMPYIIHAAPPLAPVALPAAKTAGPALANAYLSAQFGVVTSHLVDGTPRFGLLVANRLCEAGLKGQHKAACEPPKDVFEHPRAIEISYRSLRYLYNGGTPLNMSDKCLAGGLNCGIRHIVLGANYRLVAGDDTVREDLHLTPIGRLPGAHIHAAIAADPYAAPSHLLAFAIDIAIASLAFGPMVAGFWKRYFRQRIQPADYAAVRGPPEWAYLWLCALFIAYVLVVLLALMLATALYAEYNIWIAPATMAVGMAVEAFVTGSSHVAKELLNPSNGHHHTARAERVPPQKLTTKTAAIAAVGLVPRFLGIVVVCWALMNIFHIPLPWHSLLSSS